MMDLISLFMKCDQTARQFNCDTKISVYQDYEMCVCVCVCLWVIMVKFVQ